MTANFPTAFDVIPDPSALTGTADSGYYHDVLHANANDAIYAVQQKVGLNGSSVTSSFDYILHGHQHTGTDGTSILPISVHQPATDGPVQTLSTAGGTVVSTTNTSTSAIATQSIYPISGSVIGQLIKAPSGTLTADLSQWQNSSGGAMAGVTASGGIYATGSLVLYRAVGGTTYLTTTPSTGEVDFQNGPVVKGFSGSGVGQQWGLDASQGILTLGGPSGNPALILNNWHTNRTSEAQLWGKDNADQGLTSFGVLADADGAVVTARSMVVRGNLGKTASGAMIGTDNFMVFSYPTYDGNVTYTKSGGVSVLPGINPTLTAGQFAIAGGLTVSQNSTFSGSLAVVGAITATSATSTFSTLSTTTLNVSGTSTLSTANVTTLNLTGTLATPTIQPSGITGATGYSRYVGATAGVPTTGTFSVDDWGIDTTAPGIFINTAAGSPGSFSHIPLCKYQARMYRSSSYTTTTAGFQIVPLDTDSYDPYNRTTNGSAAKYTCPVAGFYRASGTVTWPSTTIRCIASLYKNGVEYSRGNDITPGTASFVTCVVNDLIQCAANDTIQLYLYNATASSLQVGQNLVYMSVCLESL